MANNTITKVNVQEIKNLIEKLNKISKNINSNINEYQKNLDTIEKAGYLKGVAEFAINNSCSRIAKICSEYDEYSVKIIRNLNKVISETQQIETSEKSKIQEIISMDPTTFTGSARMAIRPDLSKMPATLANAMQEVQKGVAVAGGVTAATLSKVATTAMQQAKNGAAAITGTTGAAAKAPTSGISAPKEETAKITSATAAKPTNNATTTKTQTATAEVKKEPVKEVKSAAKETTAPAASTVTTTAPSTTGKKMDIPSGSTSFKSYTKYTKVSKSTPQGAVVYGTTSPYGKYAGTTYNTQTDAETGVRYVTFEGDDTKYYCAAMGTYYGEVGDTFSVTTDEGNSYNVIMCDAKGSDAQGTHNGGTWYHTSGSGNKCLTEFYIDYPADDIKVYRGGEYIGTTGSYNDCSKFKGNITSITKLS